MPYLTSKPVYGIFRGGREQKSVSTHSRTAYFYAFYLQYAYYNGKILPMEELKDVIARNLVAYRKNAGLTQQEIADKINYSDKAVSKWERGDGTPDVAVLKEIADIYGVTVNDFLIVHSDKPAAKARGKTRVAKHWLVGLLSFGLVWFVATIVMVIGLLIRPDLPIAEYAYIIALPVSMIVAVVFCCIWGRLWMKALSVSALVWSLCVMIDVVFSGLSGITLGNSWLIYVMGGALQLLVILWFLLRFFMKRGRNGAKNNKADKTD